MNSKITILIITLIAAVTPAYADYVNIFGANQWARLDSHTIIVYRYSRPLCLVKTFGFIYPTSEIQFLDDYISNYDKMIIDREVVEIREVKRL